MGCRQAIDGNCRDEALNLQPGRFDAHYYQIDVVGLGIGQDRLRNVAGHKHMIGCQVIAQIHLLGPLVQVAQGLLVNDDFALRIVDPTERHHGQATQSRAWPDANPSRALGCRSDPSRSP